MADNWGSRVARGFGFGDVKSRKAPDISVPRYLQDSSLYQPTYHGDSGILSAMSRKGTSYDPRVMSDQDSTWAELARRRFEEDRNAIFSKASGGSFGRGAGSLARNQAYRSAEDLAAELANRSANMRLTNEANISQQQQHARGLAAQGVAQDINTMTNYANFQQGQFDKEEQLRRADEAELQQNAMKIPAIAMSFGDAFMKKYTGMDTNTAGIATGQGGGAQNVSKGSDFWSEFMKMLGGGDKATFGGGKNTMSISGGGGWRGML